MRLVPAAFLLLVPQAHAQESLALTTSVGFAPEAIRQGQLGMCYFYASLASVAQARPDYLQQRVESLGGGTFKVTFPNSRSEVVHPEDVKWARDRKYDWSRGVWPLVYLRAYGQRQLRLLLVEAAGDRVKAASEKAGKHRITAELVSRLLDKSDGVLLAYDRAIRESIKEDGSLDRGTFEARLEAGIAKGKVSQIAWKGLKALMHTNLVEKRLGPFLAEHGEAFGAYKSVGEGGDPAVALRVITGGEAGHLTRMDPELLHEKMSLAVRTGMLMVAGSQTQEFGALRAEGLLAPEAETWFVPRHAYSVLGYDPATRKVRLRNPWGTRPSPEGSFTLDLETFARAYRHLTFGLWP